MLGQRTTLILEYRHFRAVLQRYKEKYRDAEEKGEIRRHLDPDKFRCENEDTRKNAQQQRDQPSDEPPDRMSFTKTPPSKKLYNDDKCKNRCEKTEQIGREGHNYPVRT